MVDRERERERETETEKGRAKWTLLVQYVCTWTGGMQLRFGRMDG